MALTAAGGPPGLETVAAPLQIKPEVVRQRHVVKHQVRLPLVMQPRRRQRLLQRRPVQCREHHLQHGRDDARAAGGAERQHGPAVAQHDGGRHARQGAFARRDDVRLTVSQPEEIRRPGAGDEVVHLVVQHDAERLRRHERAERAVDRLRQRHHVAPAVHHAQVRGSAVVGLARRRPGGRRRRAVALRRLRSLAPDRPRQRLGMIAAREALDGHVGEVRVAKVARAIRERVLERFEQQMRRVVTAIDPFVTRRRENVARLGQAHAAR